MGYATVAEVDALLAQALTSARPRDNTSGQKIKLINTGETRDINRIPNDVVEFYISLADSQIDGILTEMYEVPMKKCVHGEWRLSSSLSEYNQTVEIESAINLVPGDEVIIRDDSLDYEEHHIVQEVIDQYSFTLLQPTVGSFDTGTSRVIRISFPPPINQISARYACSFIYDKYFAAQNSPNVSDYGKELRKIAMQQLNDILNGKVILREPCTRRIGDRFGNAYLDSSYSHRTPVDGYNTQDRNMSQI
jgi:hypothetical protein